MRRILRKIGSNQHDELGDVSTLADPSVVELIVKKHREMNQEWKTQIATCLVESIVTMHSSQLILSMSFLAH